MAFTERLFLALRLGPEAVRRLIDSVEPELYDMAKVDGRFTLREAVAHLADCEPIFLARIVQTVQQPGSTVPGFDESVRAGEQGYKTWDVAQSLDQFAANRQLTLDYLATLQTTDFDKVAPHVTRGPMSALEYAWGIVGHDLYHLEHLTLYLTSD
ncbi:MAG: DinB family protein [Armatimonadota bacterium]